MSNYLAVATVTSALKILLATPARAVPGATVTSVRPDAIGQDGLVRGINVFLYLVSTNPTFENQDVPTRRADGTVVRATQAALDLNYLISFYGDESKLEPQLLLAGAVAELRRQPVLTRSFIADVIQGTDLSTSDLGLQNPLVTVSPQRLDLDTLYRIWSVFFQVPYNLSVAYRASVVLVDSDAVDSLRPPIKELHIEAHDTLATGGTFETVVVKRTEGT
jgi:hypothetical protein